MQICQSVHWFSLNVAVKSHSFEGVPLDLEESIDLHYYGLALLALIISNVCGREGIISSFTVAVLSVETCFSTSMTTGPGQVVTAQYSTMIAQS